MPTATCRFLANVLIRAIPAGASQGTVCDIKCRRMTSAGSHRDRSIEDHTVAWTHICEQAAREFLDEIWIRFGFGEELHLPREIGTHGLEARKFLLEPHGPCSENFPCFKAVSAVNSMESEIAEQAATDDQQADMPRHPHLASGVRRET